MEYFSYDHRFIPERAKYPVAVFRMRVAVSKESETITPELLPATSAQEFNAEFVDESDSDYLRFELYDGEGNEIGGGSVHVSRLPAWLVDGDARCHVTVQIQYDEAVAKEQKGWSDEDIKERRDQAERKFETIFGIAYP